MSGRVLAAVLFGSLFLLTACGGGGGGGTPAGNSLMVEITGLPPGLVGDVLVLGPDGYQRTLTATTTLSGLAAGAYEVIPWLVEDTSGSVYAAEGAEVVVSPTAGRQVEVGYALDPVVLTEDAVVLSEATLAGIVGFTPATIAPSSVVSPVAYTPYGEFVFSVDTTDLQALEVGDVFAVGVRPEVPYGAIGRVTHIDRTAGTVRVTTSDARLADKVQRGSGLARGTFSPSDVATSVSAHPELAVSALPSSGSALCWSLEGRLSIDTDNGAVVPGMGDTNATIHGEYCLEPGPWKFEIQQRGMTDVTTSMTVDWDVTSSVVITFEQDIGFDSGFVPLHTLTWVPLTFAIGPVPVVILPQVQVGVELKGVVTVGAGIGLEQRLTMTTGGRLDAGIMQPIFWWEPSFSPPTDGRFMPVAGASAEVGAGAKARFMLYGVTGGFLKAGVFASFEADAVAQQWELNAGFKPSIGWEFDIWVYKVSAEFELFPDLLTFQLANGSFSGINVNITPTEVVLEPGDAVDFTATVTGGPDGVAWSVDPDWCGAFTPIAGGARFTADATPATRSCVVTAESTEDPYARATAQVTVREFGPPPAISGLTATPNPAVVGEPVWFTWEITSAEGPITCLLDIDNDGLTDYTLPSCDLTSIALSHAYEAPGSYTAIVEAIDARSQRSSTSIEITVEEGGSDFEPMPSYITITNISLGAASGGTRTVTFDISWNESWRGPNRPTWVEAPENWDAAWVFVKFRAEGGAWRHATLAAVGHVVPAGAAVDVPSDRVGAFVYRSSSGYGTFTASGMGLRWDYVADGVSAGASVEVLPLGIEMVYVPEGSFALGSSGSSWGEFHEGGTSNTPFVVNSQSPISLGNSSGELSWNAELSSGSPSGTTHASFPTGYGAFYLMKYQVTQGQYVDFLNSLTQTQADSRRPTRQPDSARRSMVSGTTVGSFATSLPHVPMSYLSWADGTAFADWAGLRPMTELEYEKAARGPLAPVANEYAWGSTSITRASDLENAGTITERPMPANANVNYGNYGTPSDAFYGPVRVGSFARPGDTRRDAGAGYFGALELSGNLYERAVTVGNPAGQAYSGKHGNGMLDVHGNADTQSWPTSAGAGFRGGHHYLKWQGGQFVRYSAFLRISYRRDAASADSSRDWRNGWRGARSAP